jgi:hypothetical protein
VHVGRVGALGPELKGFNRYLETVSGYMQRGRPYADVAVYLPVEDAWVQGEYPQELQVPWGAWGAYELRFVRVPKELEGYHALWVNREFLDQARFESGRIRIRDLAFRQLYLDVESLDNDALTSVLRLARAGAPVTLKRRPREPGLRPHDDYEARLNELVSLPSVAAHFALPDPLVAGEQLPDYWAREADGELYLFFAQPLAQGLTLPLRYGQSQMEAPVQRTVRIHAQGKTQQLKLIFKPYQSLLLRVDRRGKVRFLDIDYVPKTPRTDSAAH